MRRRLRRGRDGDARTEPSRARHAARRASRCGALGVPGYSPNPPGCSHMYPGRSTMHPGCSPIHQGCSHTHPGCSPTCPGLRPTCLCCSRARAQVLRACLSRWRLSTGQTAMLLLCYVGPAWCTGDLGWPAPVTLGAPPPRMCFRTSSEGPARHRAARAGLTPAGERSGS